MQTVSTMGKQCLLVAYNVYRRIGVSSFRCFNPSERATLGLVVGGWWLVAVGSGVVGSWWRLAVGGGWQWAVGGPWGQSLRAALRKKKWVP